MTSEIRFQRVKIWPWCYVLCRPSNADLFTNGEDDRYTYAPLIVRHAVPLKPFLLFWTILACMPNDILMMWKSFQRTTYICYIIASDCRHYGRDLLSCSVPLTRQLYHIDSRSILQLIKGLSIIIEYFLNPSWQQKGDGFQARTKIDLDCFRQPAQLIMWLQLSVCAAWVHHPRVMESWLVVHNVVHTTSLTAMAVEGLLVYSTFIGLAFIGWWL